MRGEELVACGSVFATPFVVQLVRDAIQDAEMPNWHTQFARVRSERSARTPTRASACPLNRDLLPQPGRRACQDQTVARRDVAGTLVVQILNRSANLNDDHVAGFWTLEVNPKSIWLRGEQVRTRGR